MKGSSVNPHQDEALLYVTALDVMTFYCSPKVFIAVKCLLWNEVIKSFSSPPIDHYNQQHYEAEQSESRHHH